MKSMSRFGISTLLFLALALFVIPAVRAGVWDHATKVTFHTSVQLPGIVLPPGDYRFQLLDSPSNRHVVQVFNGERSYVFGTFFTVPSYREQVTDKTTFIMEERPLGEPEAIKVWYYPGEQIGDEFIYSRSEKSLATAAVVPAPTEPEALPAESPVATTPPATESTVAPDTTTHSDEDVVPSSNSDTTEMTEPVLDQRPTTTEPAQKAEEELPKTASDLYLVLLLGGMLVMSGAAIRRFAKG